MLFKLKARCAFVDKASSQGDFMKAFHDLRYLTTSSKASRSVSSRSDSVLCYNRARSIDTPCLDPRLVDRTLMCLPRPNAKVGSNLIMGEEQL